MDKLAALASQAGERADWRGFVRFCEFQRKGLRADALKSLGEFLDEAANWPFEARLQFIRWLFDTWRPSRDLPQPLHARLAVPTIREWANRDPQQALAHLWLGLLGCDNPRLEVEWALELDPTLESAREALVQWIVADVDYNQHEMPALYIRDPRDDLEALGRAEKLIDEGKASDWIESAREEIRDLRRQAEGWLAAHPRQGDFASH